MLNVGFGLGIIDSAIQAHSPRSHTIIEAHPDVYAHILAQGWDKRPGVRVVFGRWQDVIEQVRAQGKNSDGAAAAGNGLWGRGGCGMGRHPLRGGWGLVGERASPTKGVQVFTG